MNTGRILNHLLMPAACAFGTVCAPVARVSAADFFIADGDVTALIAAIDTANANGQANTIHLAVDGTYTLMSEDNNFIGRTGLPVITSELVLNGNGATIQRAGGAPPFRILLLDGGSDVTLNDVTIRDGLARLSGGGFLENAGGGILNIGTLTITNATITGNAAENAGGGGGGGGGGGPAGGGGIANLGTLTATDCTISENSTESGGGGGGGGAGEGGGGIVNEGVAILINCNINDNVAHFQARGGGVFNRGGSLTATGSTISNNFAPAGGGGIYSESGTLILTGCTLSINGGAPGGGGGIWMTGNVIAHLTNCTLSENFGGGFSTGGGIKYQPSSGSVVILTNCTVAYNWADDGANIFTSGFPAPNLTNTIVSGSTLLGSNDITGTWIDDGHNIVEDGIGVTHPTSMSGDPLLGPLDDNGGPTLTHALLTGSIAIDAGDCAGGTVSHDQRDIPRPRGAACDIGAFEFVIPGDLNGDGSVDEDDLPLFLAALFDDDDLDPETLAAGDVNGDGAVNGLDIQFFVELLLDS